MDGSRLALVSLMVEDYDEAITFFVEALGFELVADEPTISSTDGHPTRWVVVRPPEETTGLLLARAHGEAQRGVVGRQHGGRVGFFLHVDDLGAARERMLAHGVRFLEEPREEPYGRVAVFEDVAGNRWDLLQPR